MRDDINDYTAGLVVPRVKEASPYDSMEVPELEAVLVIGVEETVPPLVEVGTKGLCISNEDFVSAAKTKLSGWTELDQLRVELDLAEIKLARAVEYGGAVNTGESASPQMPASASGTESAGRPATAAEEKAQRDTATPQHKAVTSGGARLKAAAEAAPRVQDKVKAIAKKLEAEKKSSLAPGVVISMKSLGGVAPKVEGGLAKAVRAFSSNKAKTTGINKLAAKFPKPPKATVGHMVILSPEGKARTGSLMANVAKRSAANAVK